MDGGWKPMKLCCHGSPLSHMFFTDDLLLFAEASENQMDVIMRSLDQFCIA